jgi:hypothetical protein
MGAFCKNKVVDIGIDPSSTMALHVTPKRLDMRKEIVYFFA